MRFFAVLFALIAFTFSARVHAQADAPPAPIDAPAPDAPAIETPPLAPEAPPPADSPSAAPATPAPDEAAQSNGCGSWPIALSGGMFEGGALALGGLTLCVGGALASIRPESSSGNCAEACVEVLVAIAVIAMGLIIAGAGLVILGPAAAIAVTIAMSIAAVGAGRAWLPVALGGSIGIITSLVGTGLLMWGLINAQTLPFVGGEPLTLADPPHAAFVGGMVIMGASGLVSLGAGLVFDLVLGGPVEEPAAPADPAGAQPAHALRGPRAQSVATAMAY